MIRAHLPSRGPTSALALLMVILVAGCAGGPGGPGVDARGVPQEKVAQADREPAVPGAQTVRYLGVEFTVPADWPVYDLEAEPTTCVRFDVPAVYLGRPGADMRCPAQVFGRASAVLVEPLDGSTVSAAATLAEGGVPADVNGLSVTTDPGAAVEHLVRATFADVGVAVTISYPPPSAARSGAGKVAAAAQQGADEILGSFKAVDG